MIASLLSLHLWEIDDRSPETRGGLAIVLNAAGVAVAFPVAVIVLRARNWAFRFSRNMAVALAAFSVSGQCVIYGIHRMDGIPLAGEFVAIAGLALVHLGYQRITTEDDARGAGKNVLIAYSVGQVPLNFLPWWALTLGDHKFWTVLARGDTYGYVGTDTFYLAFFGMWSFVLALALSTAALAMFFLFCRRSRKKAGSG